MLDALAPRAHRARDGGMVDRRELASVGIGAELDVLGVLLIAQDAVVQHHQHHRQLHAHGGLQLRPGMGETTVADQADDRRLGPRHARAQRHRQAPTQAGQSARRDETAAHATGAQAVGHPDGGIAGVGHHQGLGGQQAVDLAHQPLRTDGRGFAAVDVAGLALIRLAALRDGRLDAGARGAAAAQVLLLQCARQGLQAQPRIAHQAQRLIIAAHLLGIDVDVDIARVARIQLPGIRAVLVGPVAHQQHHVGLGDQGFHRPRRPVFAHEVRRHPDGQRMGLVHRALAHHRRGHRQRGGLLQRGQRLAGARQMDAAAGDHHRALGLGDQARGLLQRLAGRQAAVQRKVAQAGAPRGQVRLGRGLQQQVGRQEQHGGAGTAPASGGKGHVQVIVDAAGVDDAAHPLGARTEHGLMVQLLEGIAVGLVAVDILHQRDHGHRSLQRFGQRRHQQRGRRAVLRGHDPGLAAHAGIGVRHIPPRVLLAIRHLADAELAAGQMHQRGQALPEQEFHAVALQAGGDAMGDRAVLQQAAGMQCVRDAHCGVSSLVFFNIL
ncbi:hypothetical protein L543_3247 [Bordetella hinzii L60]|nr:hypothetical protein L543_3247 [Bordetella hinzii L60]